MPKLLLEHTFRGLSGRDAKADPLRETLGDISRLAAEMDWENVADDSLSASHIMPTPGPTSTAMLKRARGSAARAFTPSWAGERPTKSAVAIYGLATTGTWLTIARARVGPFPIVSGSVNDGQSRVFLVGSARTARGDPAGVTHGLGGSEITDTQSVPTSMAPPERAFLRFLIPTASGNRHTPPQGIGIMAGSYTAGVLATFIPDMPYHLVQLQLMCEFRGNTAGILGQPPFELMSDVVVLSAEAASFEVNK